MGVLDRLFSFFSASSDDVTSGYDWEQLEPGRSKRNMHAYSVWADVLQKFSVLASVVFYDRKIQIAGKNVILIYPSEKKLFRGKCAELVMAIDDFKHTFLPKIKRDVPAVLKEKPRLKDVCDYILNDLESDLNVVSDYAGSEVVRLSYENGFDIVDPKDLMPRDVNVAAADWFIVQKLASDLNVISQKLSKFYSKR